MKIEIEAAVLAGALKAARGVVQRSGTIPILNHVLIEAEGDALTIVSTDMTICMEEKVSAKVMQPGATTLSAELLFHAAANAAEGAALTITVEGAVASVVCGRSRAKIPTLPASDFPRMTEAEPKADFVMDLAPAMEWFAPFMSTDETRYYLCGVWLAIVDGSLTIAATDGKAAALEKMEIPVGAQELPEICIGARTAGLIAKHFPGQVRVTVSEGRVEVYGEGKLLRSKLVDGTRVAFERVCRTPDDHARINVDRRDIIRCIEMVRPYAGLGKFIDVLVSGGEIAFAASDSVAGTGSSRAIAGGDASQEFRFAINPGDVLRVMQSATIDRVSLLLHAGKDMTEMYTMEPEGGWPRIVVNMCCRVTATQEIEAALRGEVEPATEAAT